MDSPLSVVHRRNAAAAWRQTGEPAPLRRHHLRHPGSDTAVAQADILRHNAAVAAGRTGGPARPAAFRQRRLRTGRHRTADARLYALPLPPFAAKAA